MFIESNASSSVLCREVYYTASLSRRVHYQRFKSLVTEHCVFASMATWTFSVSDNDDKDISHSHGVQALMDTQICVAERTR